jgi:protein-S-isoprenylcysteine O-methyltransferase
VNISTVLGLAYALSEARLGLKKRARAQDSRGEDRGSLGLLWFVIVPSVALAFAAPYGVPSANLGAVAILRFLGIMVFAAGLAIRWYSIIHLGEFFTVNVAIAPDHRLIDSGPYRYVRHPSYTGALMAFLGLALSLANWTSLLLMVIPVLAAFLWRMHVEEAALLQAFGAQYREYMNRTKRLIPAVY